MSEQPPPDRPDPSTARAAGAQPRPGLEVAREALAAARAEAKRKGLRPGGSAAGSGGRAGGQGGSGAGWRARRTPVDVRSGAHPDERDPQALGSALDRLLAERGWQTDAAVGGVMGRWAVIVGPELAGHCEPVSYDDGELVVRAESTAWATQLRLLAPTLLRRLNQELGDGTVTFVRVLGPSGPTWKRGPLSVKGRGPRDTYG